MDKILKTHPTLASLSANKECQSELSAFAPVSKKYVYIMMDSGASIHAAWMQTPFPGHFVRRSVGQKNGEFAHTANGERLYNEGEFEVSGECDGILMGLNLMNMQVEIPLASVRRSVASGNDVSFYEGGGCIRNRKSGATAKFLEMGGVYSLKLKLKQPTKGGVKSKLDFVRPAP